MSEHASHPDIIKRLKRAHGHLRSTIEMIEEGRPCLELAQQLQAVEKAITNAKKTLIQDHIEHCLDHAVHGSGKQSGKAVQEFKEITKYL